MQEIGIGHIHKQCLYIMLFDVVCVCLLDIEEVIIRYILLIAAVTLPDIRLQFGNRCMQVDQDVRLNQLLVYDIKQALVQPEFIFRQGYFGKQQAFGKEIIRNSQALEEVFLLYQFFLLLVPLCHKKQFHRERILLGVLVEFRKKRIVRKFFQHKAGIIMFTQQVCQGGFPCADISFYGDEVVVH